MDCPACHQPNIDGARFCAKCGALLPAAATTEDPLIGAIVGGRFRIIGVLGEGGMGRVYDGEQQMGTSVRKVAVKTLLSQYAKDPQVLARFMRECGTVSELEHPNTIKVYDFGQTDSGELYIAMELLSGKSLETALETGPLPPDRVDRIVAQICGSLQEAHDKGIVHRDLKPANIYLTTRAGEEDYVKVLDFGIAKRDEKHSKHEAKLTQQGTVLGTPPYMSPEQFKGQDLDARSDVYSLGVMTYEMLTGRLPFDADSPWAWATQHMTAQPFPFETIPLGSSVPPKMKAAVMRALSKDKDKRPQSAREFFDEITLGTPRQTSLGGPRTSLPDAAAPGGTAILAAAGPRAGGTQIGEPMFLAGGPPAGGSPGGPGGMRTMVDSGSGVGPASPMPGGSQPSFPSGGQAFPAPPTPRKKGGSGALFAVVGVLVAGAIGGTLFMLKKHKTDDSADAGTDVAAADAAATATVDASPADEPPPPPVVDAGPADAGFVRDAGSHIPGPVVNPHEEECRTAISTAHAGHIPLAVSHYRNCDGPSKTTALAAIDNAAESNALSRGCHSMSDARSAASIGATTALNNLTRQHCR